MKKKILLTAFGTLLLVGCGEDPVMQSTNQGEAKRKAAPKQEEEDNSIPEPVDFQETAFVESERSRDPFRNYVQAFIEEARGTVSSQREVILEQYAIERLKLVAIIQRMKPERAMVIDPTGLGHVIMRGQYIGRASVVQPTGGVGAAYEVNWRVDRIRDGDVVLVRDDPSNPEVPSATRVIPLRSTDAVKKAVDESGSVGEESELRKIQERIAALMAKEAAKKRAETSSTSSAEESE